MAYEHPRELVEQNRIRFPTIMGLKKKIYQMIKQCWVPLADKFISVSSTLLHKLSLDTEQTGRSKLKLIHFSPVCGRP